MAEPTLKEAALRYAEMGLAVFPLAPRDKVPAVSGGFTVASTDVEQIGMAWTVKPECNVGIATGGMSGGLVVIDLDVDDAKGEDGVATLRSWELSHGKLPETATCVTGSGGLHLYYASDEPFDCSVDNELGVDIRGDGGYVVAPPSIHPSGTAYIFEEYLCDRPIARADDKVKAFIRYAQQSKARGKKFELPETIGSGKRNDTLYKLACSMQSRGDDDDVIYAYVEAVNADKCKPPLAKDEVKRIVESALNYAKGDAKRPEVTRPSVSLMVDGNGRPYQTIENCARVLSSDYRLAGRFRWNEIAYSKTVELPLPWDAGEGSRSVTDADYCGLAAYLEREYFLTRKEKAIDAVTNVAMANRTNPLREWLDGLSWDGTERIDTLLPCFLGCDASDYNIAVMRVFMAGAVARAYEPGTKFDYMPVLIGAQGIGKSMFLRRLAGKSEWYCDNFNTVEGDAAAEKLRGMWIVELAELLATKRQKDVESIKAFITSTVDTIRPKYARETVQRPRVCVFAGTTNNPHFLTDKTGNRRFLPVECGLHDAPMSLFEKDVEHYFEQAWAEAVHKHKTEKPPLVLDGHLQDYAMKRQKRYLEDDPRVGLIQDYLDEREASDGPICVAEICERALSMRREDYQNKRSVANEIHAIMRNEIAGWRRMDKKVRAKNYGPQYCYEREEKLEESSGTSGTK